MQFGPEQGFIGSMVSYSRDQRRGERATEAVLDDFLVLGGAEEQADGGVFVGLAMVAVEGFEVEIELAEVFRAEFPDLEFDGDEAVQATMKKEQVEGEVLARQPGWDAGNR